MPSSRLSTHFINVLNPTHLTIHIPTLQPRRTFELSKNHPTTWPNFRPWETPSCLAVSAKRLTLSSVPTITPTSLQFVPYSHLSASSANCPQSSTLCHTITMSLYSMLGALSNDSIITNSSQTKSPRTPRPGILSCGRQQLLTSQTIKIWLPGRAEVNMKLSDRFHLILPLS